MTEKHCHLHTERDLTCALCFDDFMDSPEFDDLWAIEADPIAVNPDLKAPEPGSEAARAIGCCCPVLDNGHGKGYLGQPDTFVYSAACRVHFPDQPVSHV